MALTAVVSNNIQLIQFNTSYTSVQTFISVQVITIIVTKSTHEVLFLICIDKVLYLDMKDYNSGSNQL